VAHLDAEGRTWDSVDHACLLRFMQSIRLTGAKEATLHQARASVSAWYVWLMRVGRSDKNPIDMLAAVKLPKPIPKPKPRDMTAKILAGLAAVGWRHEARNRMILEMLYASGVRREELLALDVEDLRLDVDPPHVVVRRGKGKMDRLALLNAPAVAAIKAWLPIRGRLARKWELGLERPLLVSQKGHRLCDTQLYRIVAQAAERITGEHMSPHQWRHSFATDMLEDGANPMVIKELLGHERLSSTERYLKVAAKLMKQQYDAHHPRRS
jgi:integrase/recombinase XerC